MGIAWLVQRFEMPLEGLGLAVITEGVYTDEQQARDRCTELDPNRKGFEYICPCGCMDIHFRSWDVEAVPFYGDKG